MYHFKIKHDGKEYFLKQKGGEVRLLRSDGAKKELSEISPKPAELLFGLEASESKETAAKFLNKLVYEAAEVIDWRPLP